MPAPLARLARVHLVLYSMFGVQFRCDGFGASHGKLDMHLHWLSTQAAHNSCDCDCLGTMWTRTSNLIGNRLRVIASCGAFAAKGEEPFVPWPAAGQSGEWSFRWPCANDGVCTWRVTFFFREVYSLRVTCPAQPNHSWGGKTKN